MWLFVFISTLLVIFESLMTQLFSFWQAQAQDGQGVMISLQNTRRNTTSWFSRGHQLWVGASVSFSPAIRGEGKWKSFNGCLVFQWWRRRFATAGVVQGHLCSLYFLLNTKHWQRHLYLEKSWGSSNTMTRASQLQLECNKLSILRKPLLTITFSFYAVITSYVVFPQTLPF